MAGQVQATQHLHLVPLHVEAQQVDRRRPRLVEDRRERSRRHGHVVLAVPALIRGARSFAGIDRGGEVVVAQGQLRGPALRDEGVVVDRRSRPIPPALLEELRDRLDQDPGPALEALQVVGIAVLVAVVGAGLDEEPVLRQVGFEPLVEAMQSRAGVALGPHPFEEHAAASAGAPNRAHGPIANRRVGEGRHPGGELLVIRAADRHTIARRAR